MTMTLPRWGRQGRGCLRRVTVVIAHHAGQGLLVASQPVWTLQLVLDQGAWEEVLTLDSDGADVLQELFRHSHAVYFLHRAAGADVRHHRRWD